MHMGITAHKCMISLVLLLLLSTPIYGKDDRFPAPKEFGIYIKTENDLIRLLPNIVFNEQGVLYIESNNPARFLLKDIEYFVIYGKYDLNVLTINPLLFLAPSPLGKPRFIFGQNMEFEVKKRGNGLYTVRTKGLLGRGYICLWIEDSAWDFVIE